MEKLVSVSDFETAAKAKMSPSAHSNINVGSNGQRV
jgi:isopentenyl diphosphate isomerase/L-lactate dehydrogenase-like FMN-dependent dehydrogenase